MKTFALLTVAVLLVFLFIGASVSQQLSILRTVSRFTPHTCAYCDFGAFRNFLTRIIGDDEEDMFAGGLQRAANGNVLRAGRRRLLPLRLRQATHLL